MKWSGRGLLRILNHGTQAGGPNLTKWPARHFSGPLNTDPWLLLRNASDLALDTCALFLFTYKDYVLCLLNDDAQLSFLTFQIQNCFKHLLYTNSGATEYFLLILQKKTINLKKYTAGSILFLEILPNALFIFWVMLEFW